jgi:hypothetical protein
MEADVEVLVTRGQEVVLDLFRPGLVLLRDGVRLPDLLARHRVRPVPAVEVREVARKRPQVRQQRLLLRRRSAAALALHLLNVQVGLVRGQVGEG